MKRTFDEICEIEPRTVTAHVSGNQAGIGTEGGEMKQIIIELTAMLIFAVAAWAAWRALLLPPHGPSETILEVVAAICSILALFSLSNTVRLVWRWAMDRPEPLEEWEDIITLTDVGEE